MRSTDTATDTSTMPGVHTTIPTAARRAVQDAAAAYATGTDEQYTAAVTHLTQVTATLSPQQRASVNDLLASTAADLRRHDWLARVRGALRSGDLTTVRALPGGVELVQVHAPGIDQLLIALPTAIPGDSARIRARVRDARDALLTGCCRHCGAQLQVVGEDQLELPHASQCALHPDALDRLRARRNR